MITNQIPEERVFWCETYYARVFDFRARILFWRFDACVFVDCSLLIDSETEQLSFTQCTFKDCNIDHIETDETRGIIVKDNFFDRPIALRKADFDQRLTQALNLRRSTSRGIW